ncbi:MAG: helix-turn-helix transcriptional regulator [Hyphomicrobiales bacterium]
MNDTNHLIAEIYAAAADPSRWNNVVMQLHGLFPGGATVLYGQDSVVSCTLGMIQQGLSPDQARDFVEHYSLITPFSAGLKTCALGVPQRSLDIANWDDVSRSEYFNDFMLPRKSGAGVGLVLFREDSRTMILTQDCDYRERDEIEPEIVAKLSVVAFHLKQSFDLMRRIEGVKFASGVLQSALAQIHDSAFIIDRRNRLVTCNALGERMLTTGDFLKVMHGRLQFVSAAAQEHLLKATDAVSRLRFEGTELSGLFTVSDNTWLVSVCPIAEPPLKPQPAIATLFDERAPVACVTVRDITAGNRQNGKTAARLFGLSKAEVQLAQALLRGEDLASFALDRQISIHTARSQLKSIFSKTDTKRQSELVLLMARLQDTGSGSPSA